jgi:hypothetical protein
MVELDAMRRGRTQTHPTVSADTLATLTDSHTDVAKVGREALAISGARDPTLPAPSGINLAHIDRLVRMGGGARVLERIAEQDTDSDTDSSTRSSQVREASIEYVSDTDSVASNVIYDTGDVDDYADNEVVDEPLVIGDLQ